MKYISNYEKYNEKFLDKLFKGKKPTEAAAKEESELIKQAKKLYSTQDPFSKWCDDKTKFINDQFVKQDIKSSFAFFSNEKEDYGNIEGFWSGASGIYFPYDSDEPEIYLTNPSFSLEIKVYDPEGSRTLNISYENHKYELDEKIKSGGFDEPATTFLYTIAKFIDPKTQSTIKKLGDNIKLYED